MKLKFKLAAGVVSTLMFVGTACLFAVSPPQQLLLLQNSRGSEMMGAACVQIAFNLGNAVGAYVGGLPVEAGMGYRYPALAGVFVVILGLAAISVYIRRERMAGKVCEWTDKN